MSVAAQGMWPTPMYGILLQTDVKHWWALQSNCTGLAGLNILHESAKLIRQRKYILRLFLGLFYVQTAIKIPQRLMR